MAKKYVFKSKFRNDVVSLVKGLITTRADGSRLVEGGINAEFSHNTFTTHDPKIAELLREAIEERRKDGRPLGIFETTDADAPEEIVVAEAAAQPKVTKGVRPSKGA